jgi:endonuclease YncB( thermonuclease family)
MIMVKKDIKVDKVKKNFYITLVVLITVLTITYVYTRPHKVVKVTEDNLLILDNGKKIVLIGIDASRQAGRFISNMVEGKEVTLDYDSMQPDKKGMLYAYVYLSDGTFVNAEVIRKGYARVNTRFPFMYSSEFINYQMEAQADKRGLWSD